MAMTGDNTKTRCIIFPHATEVAHSMCSSGYRGQGKDEHRNLLSTSGGMDAPTSLTDPALFKPFLFGMWMKFEACRGWMWTLFLLA